MIVNFLRHAKTETTSSSGKDYDRNLAPKGHAQCEEIKKIVNKNSKDIEDLNKQMAMGTGGIKAVFVIGALVAMFFSIFSFRM